MPATTAPTSIIGAIVLSATFPEAVVLVVEVPAAVPPVVEPIVVVVVAAVAVTAVPVGKGPVPATVKVAETISRISVPGRTYVLSRVTVEERICHDWLYEQVAVVGVGEPVKVHPVLVYLESSARGRIISAVDTLPIVAHDKVVGCVFRSAMSVEWVHRRPTAGRSDQCRIRIKPDTGSFVTCRRAVDCVRRRVPVLER